MSLVDIVCYVLRVFLEWSTFNCLTFIVYKQSVHSVGRCMLVDVCSDVSQRGVVVRGKIVVRSGVEYVVSNSANSLD